MRVIIFLDPTVRVSAIAVFEALALKEPMAPEILNILAKSSNICNDSELSNSEFSTANEDEPEEIVYDDFNFNFNDDSNDQETEVSSIVQISFNNIVNEVIIYLRIFADDSKNIFLLSNE